MIRFEITSKINEETYLDEFVLDIIQDKVHHKYILDASELLDLKTECLQASDYLMGN